MHNNMSHQIQYFSLWIDPNKKAHGMHSLGRQGEIDVYAFDKDRVIDNWPSDIFFP